jgi:hypothetical protein
MNKSKVFKLNSGKGIATIYKSGTSSLTRAIVEQELPETLDLLTNGTRWGTGQSFENGFNHQFVPYVAATGLEILSAVRDPVERFRSACAQLLRMSKKFKDASIEDFIENAQSDKPNPHLKKVTETLRAYNDASLIKVYKFPDHFEAMVTDAGMTWPIAHVNESETKPDLTPEQTASVQAIYADDIALFDSITEAGQVWTAPPEPVTQEAVDAALNLLKVNRVAAERSGFTFNGKHFQTRNEIDILNITNVGIASADPNFQTQFRSTDNSWVPMDASIAKSFYQTMVASGGAIWQLYGQKEAQVLSAANMDELDAVDLTFPAL